MLVKPSSQAAGTDAAQQVRPIFLQGLWMHVTRQVMRCDAGCCCRGCSMPSMAYTSPAAEALLGVYIAEYVCQHGAWVI
jgi:hypothetical protein